MKRLLFYSHDSYGLGNIRRMVAIAEHMVKHHSDIYILLLTGSSMLHAFRTHPQIDYVKLPCMQRDCDGQYQAKLACLSNKKILKLRRKLIKQCVKHFKPDLLLIDKKPIGLSNELSDSFAFLTELKCKPRTVLLLRDILDQPEITSNIWLKNNYFPFVENHYDKVAIAGQATIFDAATLYQFPRALCDKTTYLGYLKRVVPKHNQAQSDNYFTNGPEKRILVAVGGGNDGVPVLKTYLQGLSQVSWNNQLQSLLVCGPEMSELDYALLHELTSDLPNVTLVEFTRDFITCLAAADLVISMGGYNTLCEILSVNKPAIIIPRTTPVAEQLIRAECFNHKEIISYIHPDHLESGKLMDMIYGQLFRPCVPTTERNIDMDGMENIRRLLVNLMD